MMLGEEMTPKNWTLGGSEMTKNIEHHSILFLKNNIQRILQTSHLIKPRRFNNLSDT